MGVTWTQDPTRASKGRNHVVRTGCKGGGERAERACTQERRGVQVQCAERRRRWEQRTHREGRDGDEAASALGAQKHPLVISNHGLARIPGPPKVPGVPRAARGVWRGAKDGELALGHFALSLLPLSLCGQRDPGFAG